jgi:RND family efflux transporter MFP subunit
MCAAALLLIAGCAEKQEEKPPPRAIRVGVLPVDRGEIRHWVKASGPLKFIANTIVSSEVSAQVKSILVTDGQAVSEGDVLLVFDDTKIRESANQAGSNLQKDEATLAYRKIDWEKNRKLYESGTISHTAYEQKLSEYHETAAQVEADRAMLAKAMNDLRKTCVKAPISGRVSKRYIEKGDWAPESGKLFQVSDFSRVYLQAYLPDTEVAKLDVKKILGSGVDAEVTVDSYPGEVFQGKLSFIDPSADGANLFEIRIYVRNPDMRLLQGMFARGRVIYNDTKGVVRVPLAALMDQIRANESNRVFIAREGGKAHLRTIRLGTVNDTYAEVVEGLNEGEAVISQGKDVIGDGQPVIVGKMMQP